MQTCVRKCASAHVLHLQVKCKQWRAHLCDARECLHSFLRFVSERSRVSERCRQGLLTSLPVRRVGIAPHATFLSTPPRRRRKTEVDLTWSDPPVQVKPIDSVLGRKAFRGPEALGCGPALQSRTFFSSSPSQDRPGVGAKPSPIEAEVVAENDESVEERVVHE